MESIYNSVKGCMSLMNKGFTLAFYEMVADFDIVTERSHVLFENTRLFKSINGSIYCRGGSIMYPPPISYDDGWEVYPLEDPEFFFEMLFSQACLHKIYICEDETPCMEVWNYSDKFTFNMRVLCPKGLKNIEEMCKDNVQKTLPLKIVSALDVRNQMGLEYMRSLCFMFDLETQIAVFKPVVLWV